MERVQPGAAKLFNANTSKEDGKAIIAAMLDKKSPLKLLYVTPEKLAKSKRFMSKLQASIDIETSSNNVEFINHTVYGVRGGTWLG